VLLLYSRPEAHSRLSPFVPKKFAKMHSHSLPLAALSLLSSSALAAPAAVPELYADGVQQLGKRLTISPYQPVSAACPDTPLVRNATEIGSEESAYISSRKEKADAALADWLQKQGSFSTDSQPTVALASSGGGYRAHLAGAGVIKAFDARDSNSSVSGLYQALTYQSGLSGTSNP
jgi:lysophospholipase